MHDDSMADETMEDETMKDDSMDDDSMDDDSMDDDSMDDDSMDDDSMDDDSMDDESMDDESMDDDSMDDESMDSAMMDLRLWQTLPVTNAATGESFTLGDFHGQTVFVEPMATWCSNCRTQQGEVQQAKAQLGDDVVFVGLSLETTLPAADLASYAQGNGFDWTYAVMSNDLLAGLADEFGRSITSAPSTPHFIIRPDGSVSELSTGIHSAEDIIAQIEDAHS
jgi:hypothetical protein